MQVKMLGKFFVMSFSWGFFQWFYTGGDGCGFMSFPTLGLEAYRNKYCLCFFIHDVVNISYNTLFKNIS